MSNLSRRSLIAGLVSLVAAPAIVRAGSLMPVKLVNWRYPQIVKITLVNGTKWILEPVPDSLGMCIIRPDGSVEILPGWHPA